MAKTIGTSGMILKRIMHIGFPKWLKLKMWRRQFVSKGQLLE